ncbi:MAG: hypothetical protein LBD13_04210, partial [Spirochaetaceae bacterium]|nr:hypothetical protein [Spirochaetaceae bacterium]
DSDLERFESNPDFFVCGLLVYSSIVYGLLRDSAVCSGLPGEPAPPAPSAGFLVGFFYGAALRVRFLKRFGGNQFPQTPNQCDVCSATNAIKAR